MNEFDPNGTCEIDYKVSAEYLPKIAKLVFTWPDSETGEEICLLVEVTPENKEVISKFINPCIGCSFSAKKSNHKEKPVNRFFNCLHPTDVQPKEG